MSILEQNQITPLSDIKHLEKYSAINCLVICKLATDLIPFRNGGGTRRVLTLVDQSGYSIKITLWNDDARNFIGVQQPILLLNVGIDEYNEQINLKFHRFSQIFINLPLAESQELLSWYNQVGKNLKFINLAIRYSNLLPLEVLNNSTAATNFHLTGLIVSTTHANIIYKACPVPECSKKLVLNDNDTYYCEKCNLCQTSFQYRLNLRLKIADLSGHVEATCFGDVGEYILDTSMEEINDCIVANDMKMVHNLILACNYKQFLFVMSRKSTIWNDKEKYDINIQDVAEIDEEQYQNYLIDELKNLGVNV